MVMHQYVDLRHIGGRVFVVGDIHGAMDELALALVRHKFDGNRDYLFSVGDLIDRGPKSAEVLHLFEDTPHFYAVRGNHEEMILEQEVMMHRSNGGRWFYDLDLTHQDEIEAIIRTWPVAITVLLPNNKKIGIVHADVPHSDWKMFANSLEHDLRAQAIAQWSRKGIQEGNPWPVKDVDMVYMGHTPRGAPVSINNRRWIDTGAHHTGILTMEEFHYG